MESSLEKISRNDENEPDTLMKDNNSQTEFYGPPPSFRDTKYVKNLEHDFEELQSAFLQLTSQFARLQFRIRQLKQASPSERETLINDLDRIAFSDANPVNSSDELPRISRDHQYLGDIKQKQHQIMHQLRDQIRQLDKVVFSLNEQLAPQKMQQNVKRNAAISEKPSAPRVKADPKANVECDTKKKSSPTFIFTIKSQEKL